jgi:aminopeptidase N
MTKTIPAIILILLFTCQISTAQEALIYESGGELTPEQAAFNVHFYELDLTVNPADSTVTGSVDIHFNIVHPTNRISLALDPRLEISAVKELLISDGYSTKSLRYIRSETDRRFFVYFPKTLQPGTKKTVRVDYGGVPRAAPRPPWNGGMVWERTPSDDPWVGVTVQTIGAWAWWPNKDHPSDRADSVAINLTMPDDLVVASNGRLKGKTDLKNGWKTWHWFVSTPISNYNVTLNAAPYKLIEDTYTSISGEQMDLMFWVLPEYLEEGKQLFPQFAEQLRFMEEIAGPYPFPGR